MKPWLITLAAALLAACAADARGGGQRAETEQAQPAAARQPAAQAADGLRGQWRLVALNGQALPAGMDAYLDLRNLPHAGGHLGCNRLMFRLQAENGRLRSEGGVIATKMMCEETIMAYENQLTAALYQGGLNYRTEGEGMVWEIPGRVRFEFKRRQ